MTTNMIWSRAFANLVLFASKLDIIEGHWAYENYFEYTDYKIR